MDPRKKFFNLSLDLLCIANSRGEFIDVNESFTRVLGHEKEELLSQPFLNLIHPDDLEATKTGEPAWSTRWPAT